MTEQEAILRLKDHFRMHNDGRPTPYLDEAVNMAISALEKQIPKKPDIIMNKYDGDKLARCPICEQNIDWMYDGFWRKGKPIYCCNCGQKIDWSNAAYRKD